MKKTTLFTLALACISFLPACNNDKPDDSKEMASEANDQKFDDTRMEDDAQWAVKVADGGMMEVQLGKLAQANAASAAVKDFGRMMEQDHTNANNELKELAARKNISLPAAMSQEKQEKYDDLAKKTGADFDKAYMSLMVDDHEEDLDKFRSEADKGKDPDMKAWAAKTVPTLEHHLEMAKSTRDAVK